MGWFNHQLVLGNIPQGYALFFSNKKIRRRKRNTSKKTARLSPSRICLQHCDHCIQRCFKDCPVPKLHAVPWHSWKKNTASWENLTWRIGWNFPPMNESMYFLIQTWGIFWVVVSSIFFILTPKIGEDESTLTSIFFQMGWFNHQLVFQCHVSFQGSQIKFMRIKRLTPPK